MAAVLFAASSILVVVGVDWAVEGEVTDTSSPCPAASA